MKIIGLLLTLIVITAHSFGFELFSILSMIHFFFSSSSFFFPILKQILTQLYITIPRKTLKRVCCHSFLPFLPLSNNSARLDSP